MFFCGTSLDNAKLYQASIDLSKQLRTFMELSTTLTADTTTDSILAEILENARGIISANRAALFLFDNDANSFTSLCSVGDDSIFGTTFAQITVSDRKTRIFSWADNVEHVPQLRVQSKVEQILSEHNTPIVAARSASKEFVVHTDESEEFSIDHGQMSLCCIPLMNSEQVVLGVMELACLWRIVTEDVRLLECFAVFATMSLERKALRELAQVGQSEFELNRWIEVSERKSTGSLPRRFVLPDEVVARLWTVNFDAPLWDGIGHIRVVFNVFHRYELMQTYNLTNEKLFRFIREIRDTYKKVPYHNWRHAVDVTQFVSFEIITAQLDFVLTKFELFAMFVSTVCHNANHDGFTNVYNVKAETPLGILYKNQSVMETHHCTIAIDVMSRDECNLFEALSADDNRKIWTLAISLILATDMARHFELLKTFNTLHDSQAFTMDNPDHRVLLMQLVLKCGDISNVAQPFDLAGKGAMSFVRSSSNRGTKVAAPNSSFFRLPHKFR
jgi:hypothetical protein